MNIFMWSNFFTGCIEKPDHIIIFIASDGARARAHQHTHTLYKYTLYILHVYSVRQRQKELLLEIAYDTAALSAISLIELAIHKL